MADAWVATRFIHFAAAMVAFGIAAFRLYAFAGLTEELPASDRLDRSLRRITGFSAVVALLSALAIIPFIAAEMAGSDAAARDPAIWHIVLADTEFGRAWCWHLGFTVVLVAWCAVPIGRRVAWPAMVAALLTLVSLGWTGHAAMDMGGGVTHKLNQMTHLAAAGIWLGGLVPLGVLLGRAARGKDEGYAALARVALPHFSQMGYVAVALVALTGTVNAVMLVGNFKALATTPYGRLLCVKIALFATMVALALINRLRLVPRLRSAAAADPTLRELFLSVVIEQGLGLAILAVVAILGTWPPAVEVMAM
jgi:putative copper resistance protein D